MRPLFTHQSSSGTVQKSSPAQTLSGILSKSQLTLVLSELQDIKQNRTNIIPTTEIVFFICEDIGLAILRNN
jgi:hypothetical protein